MKQYITVEQLKELNKEQLMKLALIRLDNPYLIRIAYKDTYNFEYDERTYIEACCHMNVGKMIETLGDIWIDRLYSTNYDHDIYPLFYGELCDALWDEIKEILK